MQSGSKVMLTWFFEQEELLLLEFLDYGQMINALHYCNTLHCLHEAIKANGQLGLLSWSSFAA